MPRRTTLRAATMAVVVTLLALACSNGGTPGALSGPVAGGEPAETLPPVSALPSTGTGGLGKPACELLTQGEVAQLLGNPVTPPTASGDAECNWFTQVDMGTSAILRVAANDLTTAGPECTVQRDSLSADLRREPVEGVGNEAVWAWERVAVLVQGTFLACWDDAVILVFLSGEIDQARLRVQAQGMVETVRARL